MFDKREFWKGKRIITPPPLSECLVSLFFKILFPFSPFGVPQIWCLSFPSPPLGLGFPNFHLQFYELCPFLTVWICEREIEREGGKKGLLDGCPLLWVSYLAEQRVVKMNGKSKKRMAVVRRCITMKWGNLRKCFLFE